MRKHSFNKIDNVLKAYEKRYKGNGGMLYNKADKWGYRFVVYNKFRRGL